MATENNLIENGNFKEGNIAHWYLVYGDPEKLVFRDYTVEKKVVLLEPGEVLEQKIDVARIGQHRRFLIKAIARANPNMDATCIGLPELAPGTLQELDAPPEANHSTSLLAVLFAIGVAGGQVNKTLYAEVSNAMQPFEAVVVFENLPEPLSSAAVGWLTPTVPFPGHDRRHLWITGLKIIPLD